MPKKFEEGMDVSGLLEHAGDTFMRKPEEDPGQARPESAMINLRQSLYGVRLSAIRPDPYQARHILPLELRTPFYQGTASWVETVQRWLEMAETLPWAAHAIAELEYLGDSINHQGQIKPITGQIIREGKKAIFLLLTGERRFWAVAIAAVKGNKTSPEPVITAIIDNSPSVAKQIQENTAYKALTSAGKARACARLILEANNVMPETGESSYDYHSKALDMRISEEVNTIMQDVMSFDRQHYYHLKKFLELPEYLVEVCEMSDLPERVLRKIVTYDPSLWRPAIEWFAAHPDSSSTDVNNYLKTLAGERKRRGPRPPSDPVSKLARSVMRTMNRMQELQDEEAVGAVATAVVAEAPLEDVRALVAHLNELSRAIEQRLKAL